jgi:repressor LexA
MGRNPKVTTEQTLAAIRQWITNHGIAPTIEELRNALDLGSSRTVLKYLDLLEGKGDIERNSGSRGIRVIRALKKGLETISVPIVGEVPAGPLMIAEENIEGWIRLPKEQARGTERFFLLRVRGNSMNKAVIDRERIESGDLVLVRQQSNAQSNDIVVALIDGEATVKRLSRASGHTILKPESTEKHHQPILVGPNFSVQGIVKKVLKNGSELLTLIEE